MTFGESYGSFVHDSACIAAPALRCVRVIKAGWWNRSWAWLTWLAWVAEPCEHVILFCMVFFSRLSCSVCSVGGMFGIYVSFDIYFAMWWILFNMSFSFSGLLVNRNIYITYYNRKTVTSINGFQLINLFVTLSLLCQIYSFTLMHCYLLLLLCHGIFFYSYVNF